MYKMILVACLVALGGCSQAEAQGETIPSKVYRVRGGVIVKHQMPDGVDCYNFNAEGISCLKR
jgi:hypothetical protein